MMKKVYLIFTSIILFVNVYPQSAEDLIKTAEELLKGKTSEGKFKMTVVTPDYTRTLIMESWWEENEKALIVIKSPRREAGNKTLKIKNEMWMYLKNTETTIKIPPSMMLQSWNGSDFTNDDLVRESNLNRDYSIKLVEEESKGDFWKIELTPKPDAAVVWGKLFYWVRKADYLPDRVEYYDEKGRLVRHMEYSNPKKFHTRIIPANWIMFNDSKPGHETRIELLEMKFDIKLNSRVFSFQELEKGDY